RERERIVGPRDRSAFRDLRLALARDREWRPLHGFRKERGARGEEREEGRRADDEEHELDRDPDGDRDARGRKEDAEEEARAKEEDEKDEQRAGEAEEDRLRDDAAQRRA